MPHKIIQQKKCALDFVFRMLTEEETIYRTLSILTPNVKKR